MLQQQFVRGASALIHFSIHFSLHAISFFHAQSYTGAIKPASHMISTTTNTIHMITTPSNTIYMINTITKTNTHNYITLNLF